MRDLLRFADFLGAQGHRDCKSFFIVQSIMLAFSNAFHGSRELPK